MEFLAGDCCRAGRLAFTVYIGRQWLHAASLFSSGADIERRGRTAKSFYAGAFNAFVMPSRSGAPARCDTTASLLAWIELSGWCFHLDSYLHNSPT